MRKIIRIVTYYDDGSFEEVNANHVFTAPPNNPFSPPIIPIPKCDKCGLVLEQYMANSCPQPNCPCGLGPRSFGTFSNEWELK